jgi:glycosyltransferase involved in cell wall biosynthesis
LPGKCRAGIIVTAMYVGGAERWVADLIKATQPHIEWVGVGITSGEYGDVFGELLDGTHTFRGEPACKRLGSMVDILFVWTIKDALPYAARGIPVVAISHSPPESQWARDFFGQDGVRGATHYVAVSENAKLCLPKTAQARAAVIPHGIDLERLQPKVDRERQREYWGINPASIVIGYTGRLSKEKRYHLVWQCLEYLPGNIVSVLVGDGPFIEHDRIAALKDAGKRAKLVGPTSDIGSALNAIDVLVIPSEYESFCYSILEGWAATVPVVAPEVGVAAKHPGWVYRLFEPTPKGTAKMVNAAITYGPLARVPAVVRHYGWAAFAERWTTYILNIHKETCRRFG